MSCSCINIGVDDADDIDIQAVHEKRVARKEYRCCECHRIIKRGETYDNARGKWGGSFSTFRTCSTCESIRSAFFCNGWIFGEVIERLEDHINDVDGNISSECLAGMTKQARDRVCDMIDKYWEGGES